MELLLAFVTDKPSATGAVPLTDALVAIGGLPFVSGTTFADEDRDEREEDEDEPDEDEDELDEDEELDDNRVLALLRQVELPPIGGLNSSPSAD